MNTLSKNEITNESYTKPYAIIGKNTNTMKAIVYNGKKYWGANFTKRFLKDYVLDKSVKEKKSVDEIIDEAMKSLDENMILAYQKNIADKAFVKAASIALSSIIGVTSLASLATTAIGCNNQKEESIDDDKTTDDQTSSKNHRYTKEELLKMSENELLALLNKTEDKEYFKTIIDVFYESIRDGEKVHQDFDGDNYFYLTGDEINALKIAMNYNNYTVDEALALCGIYNIDKENFQKIYLQGKEAFAEFLERANEDTGIANLFDNEDDANKWREIENAYFKARNSLYNNDGDYNTNKEAFRKLITDMIYEYNVTTSTPKYANVLEFLRGYIWSLMYADARTNNNNQLISDELYELVNSYVQPNTYYRDAKEPFGAEKFFDGATVSDEDLDKVIAILKNLDNGKVNNIKEEQEIRTLLQGSDKALVTLFEKLITNYNKEPNEENTLAYLNAVSVIIQSELMDDTKLNNDDATYYITTRINPIAYEKGLIRNWQQEKDWEQVLIMVQSSYGKCNMTLDSFVDKMINNVNEKTTTKELISQMVNDGKITQKEANKYYSEEDDYQDLIKRVIVEKLNKFVKDKKRDMNIEAWNMMIYNHGYQEDMYHEPVTEKYDENSKTDITIGTDKEDSNDNSEENKDKDDNSSNDDFINDPEEPNLGESSSWEESTSTGWEEKTEDQVDDMIENGQITEEEKEKQEEEAKKEFEENNNSPSLEEKVQAYKDGYYLLLVDVTVEFGDLAANGTLVQYNSELVNSVYQKYSSRINELKNGKSKELQNEIDRGIDAAIKDAVEQAKIRYEYNKNHPELDEPIVEDFDEDHNPNENSGEEHGQEEPGQEENSNKEESSSESSNESKEESSNQNDESSDDDLLPPIGIEPGTDMGGNEDEGDEPVIEDFDDEDSIGDEVIIEEFTDETSLEDEIIIEDTSLEESFEDWYQDDEVIIEDLEESELDNSGYSRIRK